MNRWIASIGLTPVLTSLGWQPAMLPSSPLEFGFFQARFNADETFLLEGQGWPAFNGTWTLDRDAYDVKTGKEVYRQRLHHLGSGFSASPVAADDKIYLSNEDGEMVVVAAGPAFAHVATNTMGELLMATPALSNGVMYVRSAGSLFAVGRRPQ